MGRAEQEKARAFFREVKREAPKPVYLFWGDERYLIERAVEEVRERFLGKGEVDLQHRMMRGDEASGREVVEACRTMSLFGGERLVELRRADLMKEAELLKVADYVERPVKGTVLVMTALKTDGRKPSWRRIRKEATIVKFEPLYRDQMAGWLSRQAKRYGLELAPEAADYLAQAIGSEMSIADASLEKLKLYCERGRVGLEHAKEAVTDTRERTVFEFTDALSTRDLSAGLGALRRLLEQGASGVEINTMIARHVRLMIKVHSGQGRRLSGRELAQAVGVSPYFLSGYVQGARRYSTSELISLHEKVYEADRALKSAGLADGEILERLVFAFCPPKARR